MHVYWYWCEGHGCLEGRHVRGRMTVPCLLTAVSHYPFGLLCFYFVLVFSILAKASQPASQFGFLVFSGHHPSPPPPTLVYGARVTQLLLKKLSKMVGFLNL